MEKETFEEELEAFLRDVGELELFREPSLLEVIEGLEGRTSYKFSLVGSNALIAVDGVGARRPWVLGAAAGARRPRVLCVREPS